MRLNLRQICSLGLGALMIGLIVTVMMRAPHDGLLLAAGFTLLLALGLSWIVARNLRELKTLQNRLTQAEKMASLGVLGAGMAHELSNPIMGVTGLVNYVKGKLEEGDERRQLLDDAERELNRCATLVSDLLTYSRPEFGHVFEHSAQVDCPELIERALALLSYKVKKAEVTVTKQWGADVPQIWGSPNRLEQIFLNLISNAVDAMEESATRELTLTTRFVHPFVEIACQDTGSGIAPEHLSKIFDPFFTTKAVDKGTGLGLSVTRSLIEAHRGEIDVRSELQRGTTVVVRLPLERRGQARQP